jgi:metal-responsive CopG/Arc/MetJ family transcriptional regulator
MPKTKIAFRIDADLLKQLETAAHNKGVNESDVIREALGEYLLRFQHDRSCLDVASSLGVVGADTTLASDLSTAKHHMKDFGR